MRPEQKRNLQAYADWLATGKAAGGAARLAGLSARRAGLRATLFVGRNVDALAPVVGCRTRAGEIGEALTASERRRRRVSPERILEIARDEVGGATLTLGRGLWGRKSEPTSALVVVGSPGTSIAAFRRRISKLGERLARKLAQKEVLIEYATRRGPEAQDASPEGLPPPGARLDRAITRLAARCAKVDA